MPPAPSGNDPAAAAPDAPVAPIGHHAEPQTPPQTAEHARLAQCTGSAGAWRLWGPYLAGRQWGTVREDYSASGNAWEDCLALARAVGCTRAGAVRVSMEEETYMDLLAEQGTWPLILGVLLSAYELQVEAGLPPEAVLLELYASKEPAEIMERVADTGIFEQLKLHSRTSQYGQSTRLEDLDRSGIKSFLREALEERIQSGRFDREWTLAQESEEPILEKLLERTGKHPIVETEKRLQEALGHASKEGSVKNTASNPSSLITG